VELNLFLAPGERDKVREAGAEAEAPALAEREETIPNVVRLLRGRNG
jgi:hypothetical protein